MPSVIPEQDSSTLHALPNIVGKYLENTDTHKLLQKSTIGLNKAAVLTFQTWLGRVDTQIEGLLMAPSPVKGPFNCSRLVVATSLSGSWDSKQIAALQNSGGLVPVGVVLPGPATGEKVLERLGKWSAKVGGGPAKECVCVIVA
jgi:hypothetical protein